MCRVRKSSLLTRSSGWAPLPRRTPCRLPARVHDAEMGVIGGTHGAGQQQPKGRQSVSSEDSEQPRVCGGWRRGVGKRIVPKTEVMLVQAYSPGPTDKSYQLAIRQ